MKLSAGFFGGNEDLNVVSSKTPVPSPLQNKLGYAWVNIRELVQRPSQISVAQNADLVSINKYLISIPGCRSSLEVMFGPWVIKDLPKNGISRAVIGGLGGLELAFLA